MWLTKRGQETKAALLADPGVCQERLSGCGKGVHKQGLDSSHKGSYLTGSRNEFMLGAHNSRSHYREKLTRN